MENKGLWIGIAVVALIVGLGVGFMIGKKRKMPAKSTTAGGTTTTQTKTTTVEKQPVETKEEEVIKTK